MYIIDPKTPDTLIIRLEGTPKEKEIVDRLKKEAFQIAPAQAIPLLKQMADTHQLYFNGKQLVGDFYGKVEFYYRIEKLNDGKIQVSGRLKWREYDIDVRECDWVGAGKPHWFIKGFSLKAISTSVNWKRLKQLLQPLILSGEEKNSFLEELDPEDPDCPQVVMVGGSLEQVHEPLPLLILKDRLGAFADLWMDYGGIKVPFHDTLKKMKRNLVSEKNWEKDLLETGFIKKEMATSHYYCPIDKIAKSLSFLLEIGWHIQDWQGNRVIKQGNVELNIQSANQFLTVKGKVHYDKYEADISDMVGAFNRRERFIQLGKGFSGLMEEKPEWQDLAEEAEIIGQEIKVRRSHLGALDSKLTQSNPLLVNLKEKLQNFTQIEEALPSETFVGHLRPYQQQGVNWLSFLVEYGFHGILADDMGLGKTIQVLALLSRLPKDKPHLIVVPTSLLFNWKNEFEKFLPASSIYLHHGPQRVKRAEELAKYPYILTSYATLRFDLLLFQQLSYASLILDEAQMIKNAHTITSQAVCSLDSRFRLSLTGTPLENHLGEIWSHFRFLIPDLFGDEASFEAELQAAESDSRYLQRIKKKIAPFILRRKKEEVAKDLPERIDQIVWVEMGEEQRRYYDQFLASAKGNLLKKVEADGAGKHRMEIFETILRLRQICCHPLLFSQNNEDQIPPSAKLEMVMRDLETLLEENRKVLIYSQFTSMLQLMVKEAKARQWKHAYLDGSTINREKVVSSFQEDPSTGLFFISLKAGGVGLNLTAADYVFLYDPWWNNAVEEQAINRAHRIGRKDTVIAKRFVTVESIEERMMKLKAAKQSLVGELFDEDTIMGNLSAEDLVALLQG